MNLEQLSASAIKNKLKYNGLVLKIGPFIFRIISPIKSLTEDLIILYANNVVLDDSHFVDYTVTIASGSGWRQWLRRQAIFQFDGTEPFVPLPEDHAFPLLEWSMNWCISMHAHHYLLLHSAVIEKEGCAVVMPAPPGSGKSTLCAGLVHRGWRLLSDELALISLTGTAITPLGRPISLKNQSIEVMRNFVPGAVFSKEVHDTSKGRVALMQVPSAHIERIDETAQPRWVVFPKYVAGSPPQMVPRSKANSMLELGRNSFNYMVLGLKGFEVLSKVIDASDCYDFQYSQLDDAVAAFDDLVARRND
ncbi:HprK-related kinase A [Rhodoferax sp.]|uniref:HprK-related kinase A n=1 Tax=Rhodoferax sp. TaxID=50421 RepID=UPI0025D5012F|nr:HprK-related kinase A [Rhodoferax sp.]